MISEYVVYRPSPPPSASGIDQAPPPCPLPGEPSPAQTTRSTAAGMSSAVSLSQYWKAWTNVMLRIPPELTLASTTTPTIAGPSHSGASMAALRVMPAPWNCGSR